jgi:protein SCO1/2
MTKNLVALQDHFRNNKDFGVASFSITPQYDTPKVLRAYADKYGINDKDWNLMTGDKDAIYNLANSGFNIFAAEMPDAPGGFEHSGLFALVDRQGYLRSRLDKFGNPIVYYRGAISEEMGENSQGEKEEISVLREDILKLLEE